MRGIEIKSRSIRIITCALIFILLLTFQAASSEYPELVIEIGDIYEFQITDLELLLEINGTDYMDEANDLNLRNMFGLTSNATQGDIFKIDVKAIQKENTSDFFSSLFGPVYSVNVSQSVCNDTRELSTKTDLWVLHYFALALVSSLGFDIATPESIGFSALGPPISGEEPLGPPVFVGTNRTFFSKMVNESIGDYPVTNTSVSDNITSIWYIDTDATIIGNIFSMFYRFNGTKETTTSDGYWKHTSIIVFDILADLTHNKVTRFHYSLFANTTFGDAKRLAITRYGFEELTEEPFMNTLTTPTTPLTSTPTTIITQPINTNSSRIITEPSDSMTTTLPNLVSSSSNTNQSITPLGLFFVLVTLPLLVIWRKTQKEEE
ncbi:MAG: hypothetical protein JSW11_07035 [Candidatus Heimdallarchaeota archaeon]|nr:MAG: hypothetical protein JSW11_07035 [Candidatus Heimdallarchaeota archaeon]